MQRDPALAELGDELEQLGYVVVPHGEHVCVRLPLLASVVVRTAGSALRLQPQFGPLTRSRALLLGAVGLPAAVAAAFATLGVGVASLGAAAGAAAYLLTDVYRLILTESCVGRLQSLWLERGLQSARRAAAALPSEVQGQQRQQEQQQLAPPAPDELSAVADAKLRTPA